MSRLSAIEEQVSSNSHNMASISHQNLSADRLSQLSELKDSDDESESSSLAASSVNKPVEIALIDHPAGGSLANGRNAYPVRVGFRPPNTINITRPSRDFVRLSGIGLGPSQNIEQIGLRDRNKAESPTDEEHPHEGAPSISSSRTQTVTAGCEPTDDSTNHRAGFNFEINNPFVTRNLTGTERMADSSGVFTRVPSLRTQHSHESTYNPARLSLILDPSQRPQFNRFTSLQPPLTGGNRLQMDPRLGTPWTRNGAGAARMGMPLSNRQVTSLHRNQQEMMTVMRVKSASIGQRFTAGCLFATYLFLTLFTVLFVVGQAQFGVFTRGFYDTVSATRTLLDPSPHGYFIYVILHLWNVVWIVWALALTCQISTDRLCCFRPIPSTLTSLFFCQVAFATVAHILWLFTWDRNISYASLWLLGLQFWAFLFALIVLSSNMLKHFDLFQAKFRVEYLFIKISCQNAVAGLFTMSLIESLLTLDLLLSNGDIYFLSQDLSATLILTLISIAILIYFIMDSCIFEKAVRFVVTPYLCFTWTLSSCLFTSRNYLSTRNVVILAGIIFISTILAGIRVIISILNEKKYQPIPVTRAKTTPLNLVIPLPGTTATSENV